MVDHLVHSDDAVGHAAYRENLIRIQKSTNGTPRLPEQIEHTFYHERMHWMYYVMGEDDVRNNEKQSDIGGALLHQAHISMQFTEEPTH